MFLNLIDNAVKYNERGGRVSVRMAKGEFSWKVMVGNTGRGIPAEGAEHLFDRFYRGDQSRTRKRAGHGLGLSICREIARAHAGEIVLSDFGSSWTEFCVVNLYHDTMPKSPDAITWPNAPILATGSRRKQA